MCITTGKRKYLAVFFGDNTHSWVFPESVLDFSCNLEEQEAVAIAARASGTLKSPTLFFRALDEAKIWLTVKNKKSTRSSQYVAAVSARAARMAAHENKKPRYVFGICQIQERQPQSTFVVY